MIFDAFVSDGSGGPVNNRKSRRKIPTAWFHPGHAHRATDIRANNGITDTKAMAAAEAQAFAPYRSWFSACDDLGVATAGLCGSSSMGSIAAATNPNRLERLNAFNLLVQAHALPGSSDGWFGLQDPSGRVVGFVGVESMGFHQIEHGCTIFLRDVSVINMAGTPCLVVSPAKIVRVWH